MSKVVVYTNRSGLNELRKSEGIRKLVSDIGQEVANIATTPGRQFIANTHDKPSRVVCYVRAGDIVAYRSNLKHNTLLRALGSVKK